jgi:hypothetical protein
MDLVLINGLLELLAFEDKPLSKFIINLFHRENIVLLVSVDALLIRFVISQGSFALFVVIQAATFN